MFSISFHIMFMLCISFHIIFMLLLISQLVYSSIPMKVEVLLTKIKNVVGINYFDLLPYTVMIKIYMENMRQYTLREKRLKSLVLLVLWVKGVVCPPLWYTLDLWVWGLSYLLIMTPLVDLWSFIFLLGPSALLCVSLVWWLLFYCFIVMDHMTFSTLS